MKRFEKAIAVMLMTIVVCVSGCTKPDDPNNGGGNNNGGNGDGNNSSGNGIYNGHEYVDLGLPSGTLWATCNVGAENIMNWGDNFAWGETEPRYDYPWWDGYKYGVVVGDTLLLLTKYCTQSEYGYNGFTDNLIVLEAEDDAATMNWGDGWCTPTIEQWQELRANTISQWITVDGIRGIRFASSNEKRIFIPVGSYWSASLCSDYPLWAWWVNFYEENGSDYDFNRCDHLCIRPVRSAK